MKDAVEGEVGLFPWSVCGKVQWNGQILVSHDVFSKPMFDLCRESGVAEKGKCEGLVPFGNGAVAKVENTAKF